MVKLLKQPGPYSAIKAPGQFGKLQLYESSTLIPETGASGIEPSRTGQSISFSPRTTAAMALSERARASRSKLLPGQKPTVNAVTDADSFEAITIYVCRPADFDAPLEFYVQPELVWRIEQDIDEDIEAARLEDETAPSASAIETCRWLAGLISAIISGAPGTKSAAFTQDDGGISLVVHSLATKRRAEFRISPSGIEIPTVKIDENMRLENRDLDRDQPHALKKVAEWAISHR